MSLSEKKWVELTLKKKKIENQYRTNSDGVDWKSQEFERMRQKDWKVEAYLC